MKIAILSESEKFSSFLADCFKEEKEKHDVVQAKDVNRIKDKELVIVNFLQERPNILTELEMLKTKTKKIILLENAVDLYLNSKTKYPFSSFNCLKPKNKIATNFLKVEKFVEDNFLEHIIFRTSEVYGPFIDFGIIHEILDKKRINIYSGNIDLIYIADIIQAIEITFREKNVNGIFDLCHGKSHSIKNEIIPLIFEDKKDQKHIKFSKRIKYESTFDSYKHFRWKPIVSLLVGLKTTIKGADHVRHAKDI